MWAFSGGRTGALPLLLSVLMVWGCGGEGEEADEVEGSEAGAQAVACEPVPETSLEGVAPAALEGSYRLVVVATRGPAAESRVEETLSLRVQDPELRDLLGPGGEVLPGARQVLIGTLTGGLGGVGAQVPGDLGSEDPEAPGVSVLLMDPGQAQAPTRILLRLGSEANVRGRIAFDDAFTALRVGRVDEGGFYGSWESGGPEAEARGHFCALR